MGKNSNFPRNKRDFYPTPASAVTPLIRHLDKIAIYDEPCAGDGELISHLGEAGLHCVFAGDIEPLGIGIKKQDALKISRCGGDCFITNPPWTREILHPLILHLSVIAPTFFLMDAAWAHTKQAIPYLKYCQKIISVGRVKWIADSPYSGKEDAAWYLFDQTHLPVEIKFFGRCDV